MADNPQSADTPYAAGEELPPPLELECLNVLWRLGEGNVKQVRQHLWDTRPLAYTTVMTLLDRLAKRGVVVRRKTGRSFQYKPTVAREQMQRTALRQLIDRYFDGSVDDLRRFLAGHTDASLEFRNTSSARTSQQFLDAALL